MTPRALLAALTLALLSPAALQASDPEPRIPDIHTVSFSGDRVDLPSMLTGGKLAILVLGFNKAARAQATAWGRRLPTDYFYSHDVLYYEMIMLEGVPRLLRGTVLHSIKSEVSDRSQPHFASLTTDESSWRSLVHYNKPDDAYVLLIDGTGHVDAQFQGAPTDASYQDLKRRIDQIQAANHPTP